MIKHVIFDLDNTLWDFRRNSFCALQQMFQEQNIEERYGLSFDTFYPRYSYHNEKLWEDFRDHKVGATQLKYERFANTFHEYGIEDKSLPSFFNEHYLNTITHFNHLVPGSLSLIEYLEPKYSLHILTNGFKEVTHRKIQQSDLNGHFETITSAEEIDCRKPNPKIFEYAMDKAKANKKNVAFIGDDWIADAIGARDFGFQSIYFDRLNEGQKEENIQNISKLEEVKNLL